MARACGVRQSRERKFTVHPGRSEEMWEWSFPLLSLVALYYGIPQSLGSQTYLWLVTPKGAPYIRCEPLGSEAGWWWDAADTVPISPEDLLERTSEKLGGRTSEGRADVWPTEALVLPGHEHARLRRTNSFIARDFPRRAFPPPLRSSSTASAGARGSTPGSGARGRSASSRRCRTTRRWSTTAWFGRSGACAGRTSRR